MLLSARTLTVGARRSKLSQAQVAEVLTELRLHVPHIEFSCVWVETTGDRDLLSSLRDLEKTNFFTKELDEGLLQGEFQVAIHSAKDLPDPLPDGLEIFALTKGVDPSDSLVCHHYPLPEGSLIATSSWRREKLLLSIQPKWKCVDIRGPIEARLSYLDEGKVDGVVIAEAALVRLHLTHRFRIPLPGETAPMQGRLAIVGRRGDREMKELFSYIHG